MRMVEQVFPNIYRLEIPLPKNPLRTMNSYVIKGIDRNLIIDTGMNLPECEQAMEAGLRELDIDLKMTDLFITHFHADHSGLIPQLCSADSVVYGSVIDLDVIKNIMDSRGEAYWQAYVDYAEKNGFFDAGTAVASHPGVWHMGSDDSSKISWVTVKDGDTINAGEYSLKCLATPGHTSGHFCLYEPNYKILFAGDHIMTDISPNIELFADGINPLGDYLHSLKLVQELDVDVVFSAHRRVIHNYKQRVEELIEHHGARNEEILNILKDLPQQYGHAYQIAAMMNWDIKFENWSQFPPAQKWFATGECIAHLRYLEEKGLVVRTRNQDVIVYSLP